jgi:hypothetical protein
MKIRAGYEISYDCPQPTPMILTLSVHPSRFCDLLTPDRMRLDPPTVSNTYHDKRGVARYNWTTGKWEWGEPPKESRY